MFFFFNAPAPTEIYTLSLHDALPIYALVFQTPPGTQTEMLLIQRRSHHWLPVQIPRNPRSEEHTSELQSRPHLVCRLLLEKKKKKKQNVLDVQIPPALQRETHKDPHS